MVRQLAKHRCCGALDLHCSAQSPLIHGYDWQSVHAGTASGAVQPHDASSSSTDSPTEADNTPQDSYVNAPAPISLPPPALGDRSARELYAEHPIKNHLIHRCHVTGDQIRDVKHDVALLAPQEQPPADGMFCAFQLGLQDDRIEDLQLAVVRFCCQLLTHGQLLNSRRCAAPAASSQPLLHVHRFHASE